MRKNGNMNLVTGKNKILAFKLLFSLTGCLVVVVVVVVVHQLGYQVYMEHYRPRSRGVTLGFVKFYMQYAVMPFIFFSSFLKVTFSLAVMAFIFILMFYAWYETNPLRVLLMFISGLAGYCFILLCLLFEKKKLSRWFLKDK